MKSISFNEFLAKKILELTNLVQKIEIKITTFPEPDNINLNEYGNLKELKTKYSKSQGKRIIKLILGPTKNDLKKFIYDQEISKLQKQKERIKEKINELQSALASYKDGTFKQPIYPNSYVVKTILAYSEEENIDSKEILKLLVSLFQKIDRTHEKALDKIESNIATFFDCHQNILKETDIQSLLFLFEKLIFTIIGPEKIDRYNISVMGLQNELRISHQLANEKVVTKEELLMEQEALNSLRQYIEGPQIIKIAFDLDNFASLLENSNLPTGVKASYYEKMQIAIKKEQEEKNKAQNIKLLEEFLKESDIEVFKEATALSETIEDIKFRELLERTTKDIISICRFLKLKPVQEEYQNSSDILMQKIVQLKIEINNIKNPNYGKSNLSYLTDTENYPIILRNIEVLDVTLYEEAYNLLNTLATNKNAGVMKSNQDGVTIYEIEGNLISLLYTKSINGAIVIGLKSAFNDLINNQVIAALKKRLAVKKTKESRMLDITHEELITEFLNLRNYEETVITLAKTKKD